MSDYSLVTSCQQVFHLDWSLGTISSLSHKEWEGGACLCKVNKGDPESHWVTVGGGFCELFLEGEMGRLSFFPSFFYFDDIVILVSFDIYLYMCLNVTCNPGAVAAGY